MIDRHNRLLEVKNLLNDFAVVALLGPRQCGKTTIARQIAATTDSEYFDLEDFRDIARLENPQLTLENLTGLIIIDEVQLKPELFPLLRVLADRKSHNTKFLLLGSASLTLIKHCSETLAGRIAFVDMAGFNLTEIGFENYQQLWSRGTFPNSYLGESNEKSFTWRNNFIRTFLTRDIPQLGINIPAEHMRRFWTMLAHYHGQYLNTSEIGQSLNISHKTVKRYLDILSGSFMVTQLQPWTENLGKRIRKMPKIYITDSGLLHSLLQLSDLSTLQSHPKLGASWEGFVIEQLSQVMQLSKEEMYTWSVHSGAEIDLLVFRKGKRYGFEIKYSDAPTTTKSMHACIENLGLEKLFVIYPGNKNYLLRDNIEVVSISSLENLAKQL